MPTDYGEESISHDCLCLVCAIIGRRLQMTRAWKHATTWDTDLVRHAAENWLVVRPQADAHSWCAQGLV